MIRSLTLAFALALSIGAPVALGDEPPDPEPIEDFWTAEEEAIEREQAAQPPAPEAPVAPPAPAAEQVAPPAAPAPVVAPVAPLCDPDVLLQQTLDALRPLARRTMPARGARPLGTLKVTPCMPGRLRLEIVAADSGVVLARAERVLRTTRTATLQLRTTSAVRRFAGDGPLPLNLRARFSLR